jgi:hypothetical protein
MEVAMQIPDPLVHRLQERWGDLPCRVLESVVLEGFRKRILTTEELGNIPLFPAASRDPEYNGSIWCHERLGGLLKYYDCDAA